jgi:hypothetical protein
MALNATIDLTVKKPDFKSMKSEIKELTIAAQQAVMQFGEFSPEARRAEQALAGARDRMEDFNDRVKAVNPDKFAKLQTVVQGVASGFAAAQGAMALFGNESKDFEKTMIKLQGAMALAQGLEGLGKIQQQFRAIFVEIIDGTKNAFNGIKAAIGSTGIGLLVVALGSIVAYWNDIKTAIMGVSEETKKAREEQNKYNQSIRDLNRERELLLFGELAAKKSELADIEAKQTQIGEAYIKIQQRLKIIAQSRALAGVEHGKAEEAQLRLTLQANTLKSEQLVNDEIRTRQAIRRIEESDAAKKQALADAQAELVKDNNKKELDEFKKQQERLLETIDLAYSIRKKKIYDSAEFAKKLTAEQVVLEEGQYKKEYSDREKMSLFIKTQHSELIASTLGYFNTITELANAFAANDEASQKRAFEVSKAMRYASTVLSTIEGTQNAFTSAQDSPITKVFPAYPFVQATAAALFGLAQLAKIKKSKFQSPAAPTVPTQSGGGGMPQMGAPRIGSTLPPVGQFDTKVFVTEGDIRRTSNRVDSTKKVSVVK